MKDKFIEEITSDCLKVISEKKVDMKMLAYEMGTTLNNLYTYLGNKNDNLSFYLELYKLLIKK